MNQKSTAPRRGPLLVIDPGLGLWGSERALLDTLPSLLAHWEEVVLLAPPGAELAVRVREDHPRIRTVGAPIGLLHKKGILAKARAVISLMLAIMRCRPRKIYLNQAGLCRPVALIARTLQIPLTVHVRIVEDIDRVKGLRATPQAPVQAILITESMMARFVNGQGWSGMAVQVHDAFLMRERRSPSSNRRHGVCCTGRLCEVKGQHLLVEALVDEDARFGFGRLDLYGIGMPGDPYERELRERIHNLELDTVVEMKGYVADVRDRLTRYKVMAVPSTYEPLGRVVLEAWESGVVPVVPATSGGASEIVRRSGGGLLARDRTAEAMSEAIMEALALSDEQRVELTARGRAWAARELSLDVYKAKLRGVLF